MQERPREAVVLRMVREQNGLSQNAVGFIAGCSRTWTSQLEAGVMKPAPERIARLGSRLDPRLMQLAVRMVTGGAFVSPVLDGDAVDLHPAAVIAKCIEELEEALPAAKSLQRLLIKPRLARSEQELISAAEERLQPIDVERVVQVLTTVMAMDEGADINTYYREHDRKLVARGYTREGAEEGERVKHSVTR